MANLKLSLQLTYNTEPDYPGTILVIANTLAELDWNIDRCWFGEVAGVVHKQARGTLRVSKMVELLELDNPSDIIKDLTNRVEKALNKEFPGKNSVYIRSLIAPEGFRFAMQVIVSDYRGVIKDVLETIFKPGLQVDNKEVICRLDGLLCLPMYVWGYKGNYNILDARFRVIDKPDLLIDKTDLHTYATSSDLNATEISETDICKQIDKCLQWIPGVWRWSIRSTYQRKDPITGKRQEVPNTFESHLAKAKAKPIRYHKSAAGSLPGMAYTVANDLYHQNFSIRRIVVTELAESPEPSGRQHAGVFLVKPVDATHTNDSRIKQSILDAIRNHINHLNLPEMYSEYTVYDIDGGTQGIDTLYPPDKLWISCQLEMKDKVGNLAKILSVLTDMDNNPNPTGNPLNVDHLITMLLYSTDDAHNASKDKTVLVEFLCSSTSPEENNNDGLAEALNNWLLERLFNELEDVLAISCKPVRRYGSDIEARSERRSPSNSNICTDDIRMTKSLSRIKCRFCDSFDCPGEAALGDTRFVGVINSVEKLIEIDSELGETGKRLYFRGERKLYDELLPSLTVQVKYNEKIKLHQIHNTENSLRKLQLRLLHRLQRYTTQYHFDSTVQSPAHFLEWVCLGQHHGLPSLVLDWSLNPLVALFFAQDDPCEQDGDENGQIWIMELKSKNDRIDNTIYLGNEQVEFGYPKVGDEDRSKTILVDEDACQQDPIIIVPRTVTRRIEAQTGRFVFSVLNEGLNTLTETKGFHLPWETPIKRYMVPCCCKAKIRKELRQLRIHEGTMYADLDAYARFLKNGGL